MCKASSIVGEGNGHIGLGRYDEGGLVRVVRYDFVQALRDEKDFVVLHVCARTAVGGVFDVSWIARLAVAIVEVEGLAHEAGTGFAKWRHLNCGVVLVD